MADIDLIRIIALEDEAAAPDAGQYLLTDAADGTKKMQAVKLLQNEAQTFDTSADYSVGDYVLYNGRLYRFTAAHAAGAWTGEDADAVTIGDLLEGLDNDTADIHAALATKAEIDGYYEKMTVGDAEQLVGTVFIEDRVPYNFRPSGGFNDIGNREYDEIVGGTLAWNQLIHNGNFADASAWSAGNGTLTIANGVATISMNGGVWNNDIRQSFPNLPVGHKCFWCVEYKNSANVGNTLTLRTVQNRFGTVEHSTNWRTECGIKNIVGADTVNLIMFGYTDDMSSYSGEEFSVRRMQIIDLTDLFGSVIADYIYSLEQANAGAGVAWFRKLFPMPYYTYNSGELMSVQAASHDTIGFNAWDEEWVIGEINPTTGVPTTGGDAIRSKNYIAVLPNTQYYYNSTVWAAICYYDSAKGFISREVNFASKHTFTTPNDCFFVMFAVNTQYGTVYNHDICINLSWDGERDGDYEPYVKHTYPLADLTLRGIAKLDANNQLYYDGDTYAADGTVTRRYGVVDLGTLNWQKLTGRDDSIIRWRTQGIMSQIKAPSAGNVIFNGISSKYPIATANNSYLGDDVNISLDTSGQIFVRDTAYDSMDATAFKSAMSGVMLVYELATPLTEQADPFTSPQVVDDFGTEEYVDAAFAAGTRDVAIPVGHITRYTANLRAKLEMAPDSPDGDGDYIVRQTNGENTYVPLVIPTELPAAPSGDGSYVLKATVSDGAVSYSWIAE